MDRPEFLLFGDYLSVYFPHPEWGSVHRQYRTDARPSIGEGERWDFEVTSARRKMVTLHFDGVDQVPAQLDIRLVDVLNGVILDLRRDPRYSLATPHGGKPLAYQILVGEKDYIQSQLEALDALPDRIELDQNYPNPFNPTTTIRYGLTEQAFVTITIYNVLGQVVSELARDELADPGYHVVTWNATGDTGALLPSGLYVFRLTVRPSDDSQGPSLSLARTMMLVK